MHRNIAAECRWIGALGIITIAVMRCLAAFSPQVYFDVDPALDPTPLSGLSMAGSLGLDGLLLLAAGLALFGEAMSRRGIEWKLILLALIPAPIILWHGWFDAGDLWRGSTWLAAMIAGVAIAHLARDTPMRIILAALLLAVTAPLLARGAAQITFEHADTVATYEGNREAFLRERGWEPDSPQALIYERRLYQPQPHGWFSTTNIFASVVGACMVVLLGMAVGCRRAKLPSGWMGLMLFIALLAAAGVWMSGSKGAMLATLLGAAVCLKPLLMPRVRAIALQYGWLLFMLLPFAAIAGVLARGVLLPEGFLNERSLLFRWHYLVSSLGVFADQPLAGTGPDHFQEAYVQHRLPRNPEEVVSAHSVFIDWLCMIGIFASAWIALVFIMLKRAAGQLRSQAEYLTGDDVESVMGALAKCVLVVLLLGIIPAIMVELHVLDVLLFLPRALGAVGYIALAMALGFVMAAMDRPIAFWSIAAGALVLVVHGQIEMTFFQPNAIVWLMCVIGLMGGNVNTPCGRLIESRVAGVLFAGLAIWIAVTGWWPAWTQQRAVAEAAGMIDPQADSEAQRTQHRRAAAARLVEAYAMMPGNYLPLHQAARQIELAAAPARGDERIAILRDAMEPAERAVNEHGRASSYGLRASLAYQLATMTNDPGYWDRAIDDARIVSQRDPHGLFGWRRLGDLLWFAGREAEAIEAYKRTLEINANFELDPLKQLPEQWRTFIEQRIVEAA